MAILKSVRFKTGALTGFTASDSGVDQYLRVKLDSSTGKLVLAGADDMGVGVAEKKANGRFSNLGRYAALLPALLQNMRRFTPRLTERSPAPAPLLSDSLLRLRQAPVTLSPSCRSQPEARQRLSPKRTRSPPWQTTPAESRLTRFPLRLVRPGRRRKLTTLSRP